MKTFLTALLIIFITMITSSCGQYGGLYLPKNPTPTKADTDKGN